MHRRQKRQIGVLARTGTLPQGKRSLETSACTREPFVRDNDMENSRVDILDSFIQEPKKSKSFSFLKSPAEKLDEQRNSSELLKHFIETFAGDEQLQERRLVKDQDKLRRFKGLSQKVPCSYFDLRKSCYLLGENDVLLLVSYQKFAKNLCEL